MRHHAPASRLKQLGNGTIKGRTMEVMRTARAVQYEDMSRLVGKSEMVLVTEKNSKSFVGRDASYRNVAIPHEEIGGIGDVAEIEITGSSSVCLFGSVVKHNSGKIQNTKLLN